MKQLISFLIVTTLIVGCQSGKKDLLTSVTWKKESETVPGVKVYETWVFKSDGTFENANGSSQDEKVITLTRGSWEWTSDNEITTTGKEMVISGESHSIESETAKFVLHITEISKDKLVGTTRHFGDAEGSGFENTVTYTAVM